MKQTAKGKAPANAAQADPAKQNANMTVTVGNKQA